MSQHLWIHAHHGPRLRAFGLKTFADFLNTPAPAILSSHRHRQTVALYDRDGTSPAFYLKRVFRVSLSGLALDVLCLRIPRSLPQHEWSAVRRLENCGIGVMEAVAVGWETRLGVARKAFILVHPVQAERHVGDFLLAADAGTAPLDRPAARFALARDLGRFVRTLHDAGFTWPDMFCKHVYARPSDGAGGLWRFDLIDVERLEQVTSRRRRRRDLASLLRSAPLRFLRRTDLIRFSKAYSGRSPRGTFDWAQPVWRRLTLWARRPVRLPDDFVDRHAMRFVRSGQVVYNAAFADLVEHHNLHDFDDWVALGLGQHLHKPDLKPFRGRYRFQSRTPDGRVRTFYMKRFRRPPVIEQIKRLLFRKHYQSTAWYEWSRIRRLTALRIAAMTPVAYGQQMSGSWERDSFLITAEIPGCSLESWVPEHFTLDRTGHRERAAFLRQLAWFVAAFHDAGFVHRDLYLSHIFLSIRKDGAPAFRLIDLQRVFQPKFLKTRWIVKDLAALNFSTPPNAASRSERLRFLRDYLTPASSRRDRHRLAKAVIAKTRRMAAHNPHLKNQLHPVQPPPEQP